MITQIAERLQKIRSLEDEAKSDLKVIQETKAGIQDELIEAMKEGGIKSIKTETHNYARTIKKDIKIYDEHAVIAQLREQDLDHEYVKPKLDSILFKSYAKALLKDKGEVMDGTEITETEYMTIKSNK